MNAIGAQVYVSMRENVPKGLNSSVPSTERVASAFQNTKIGLNTFVFFETLTALHLVPIWQNYAIFGVDGGCARPESSLRSSS